MKASDIEKAGELVHRLRKFRVALIALERSTQESVGARLMIEGDDHALTFSKLATLNVLENHIRATVSELNALGVYE